MLPDVMQDEAAQRLFVDLATRGVHLLARRGNLATAHPALLTVADRAALRQHKAALLVLAIAADDRTVSRLLDMRAGGLRPGHTMHEGHCHQCGDPLPHRRRLGRCGWCSLACRLAAGAPVSVDVLRLFDRAIVGDDLARLEEPLLDLAVSA